MRVGKHGKDVVGLAGDDHLQKRKAMASKLMSRGCLEAVDELESCLLQSFTALQSMLTAPYHLTSHSPAQHAHLPHALLYAILTHPASAVSYVAQLTAVTNDGYASFVATLIRLVNESFPKVLEQPRNQILWLLRQLISFSAAEVDTLCLCLLRQVAGGDLSSRNLLLAGQLLDVMRNNWSWMSTNANLLTTALYTYLRLLPDHSMAKSPSATELKQKEVAFCVQILRERFQDCLAIGRDLMRLLQDVALIPEFEQVWRDLLSNPAAFKAPCFADIAQLYVVRTPTRYLASRITPDMEAQIRFMLTHVKMGSQRRYQTWFAQRYLSTPESETLVCDLIRFICCVHHPTNQILQSDIVPRWAIVGWLLKCCKSCHVESNAKLALFYDWLFFMSKSDNIMNIEPAILLMVHSIPKYVDMTNSLLELLFLLMEHYDPARRELLQRGVTSSIDILVGKGVVRSLEPLSSCGLVAAHLREKLVSYFAPYCKVEVVKSEFQQEHGQMNNYMQVAAGLRGVLGHECADGEGMRSDDGKPSNDHGGVEVVTRKRKRPPLSESMLAEMPHHFDRLAESLRKPPEVGVSALEKLIQAFTSASDQLVTEKFAVKDSSESDSEGSSSPVNHILDSALLTLAKFSHQVTEILKKGGYEIFGPLKKLPSNNTEADETNSLTSTLLRLYVANRHPQVKNLLVFWHREGFPVGARLLCYISRLAEELEQSASASLGLKGIGSVPPPASSIQEDNSTPVRVDYGSDHTGSMGEDCDEEGELTEGSADPREHKIASIGDTSRKMPGLVKVGSSTRKSSSRDLQANEMHMRCRTAVADAFNAYEDFSRHSTKDFSSTQNDTHSSSSQGLQNNRGGVLGRADSQGLEKGGDHIAGLLSDLQTCLVWNTYRLLRVLPSVFRYLPSLATGKEEVVQLLISVLDPSELLGFEFRLSLGEFRVVGDNMEGLTRLIKKSLKWEFVEQQFFWRLLAAEAQATAPTSMTLQVLKICSVSVQPLVNVEAVGGLMALLRGQAPTSHLVNNVLSMPRGFSKFVGVVLTNWMSSHHALLRSCLRALNSGSPKERLKKTDEFEDEENTGGRSNSSLIATLLNALKDSENGRCNGEEHSVRDERMIEVRRAILQLAGSRGVGNLIQSPGTSETMGTNET